MNEHYQIILKNYTNWLDTLGFSDSITYRFPKHIKAFFNYLTDNNINHVTALKHDHLKPYFLYLETRPNKLKSGGLSPVYLNRHFLAVDKLLEFLNQMDVKNAPTPTNYRINEDNQLRINKIEPLSVEEIKQLQSQIPKTFSHFDYQLQEKKQAHLRLVFILFYGCGLRRSEGMKLEVSDINFDRRSLFIRQGKNYKDRIIPLNTKLLHALEDYVYNFRNLQKTVHNRLILYSYTTIINDLEVLRKTSNFKRRLHLHLLRHSVATNLLKNGVSIENIAQFLGHSSLESTQVYTHLSATHQRPVGDRKL